jgi:GT2 family glycosyltransferase
VGVVVVSYNTSALLDRCLESVANEAQRGPSTVDVIVVDNGSSDGSREMVAAKHPDFALIAPERNLGYAGGVNIALEKWLGAPHPPQNILILNPDTELGEGALSALMAALESGGERVAVAGPSLMYPDGRFQPAAFREPGLVQTLLDIFPVARLYESDLNGRYRSDLYAGGVFEVDFVLGACMLVRTDAVLDAGTMDDGFFMYCEEMEWCHRFRAAGWRVVCSPESHVIHHGGASTSQSRPEMWVALWTSRLRYFRMVGPRRRELMLRSAVMAGLLVRSLTGGAGAPPGPDVAHRWALARQALGRAQSG